MLLKYITNDTNNLFWRINTDKKLKYMDFFTRYYDINLSFFQLVYIKLVKKWTKNKLS